MKRHTEPGLKAKSPSHCPAAHCPPSHPTLPQPNPFPLVLESVQVLYRRKDRLKPLHLKWSWICQSRSTQGPLLDEAGLSPVCQNDTEPTSLLSWPMWSSWLSVICVQLKSAFSRTPPWLSSLFRILSLPLLPHDRQLFQCLKTFDVLKAALLQPELWFRDTHLAGAMCMTDQSRERGASRNREGADFKVQMRRQNLTSRQ